MRAALTFANKPLGDLLKAMQVLRVDVVFEVFERRTFGHAFRVIGELPQPLPLKAYHRVDATLLEVVEGDPPAHCQAGRLCRRAEDVGGRPLHHRLQLYQDVALRAELVL